MHDIAYHYPNAANNRLGNVTATIPDRKRLVLNAYGNMVYIPLIVSYTDYYPFGYPISDRSYYNGGSHYFFLFDSENDIFSTNAVKMTINPRYSDQIGKSFAHEGGHIYYEVTDPVGYANWLEKNGNQSAKSGHLKDKDGKEKNPSGQKALEWESEY